MGTHRFSVNNGIIYHKNITIEKCKFKKAGTCVNCLAWAKCNIRNNSFSYYDDTIKEKYTVAIKKKNNKKKRLKEKVQAPPSEGESIYVPDVVDGYNPQNP